MQQSFRIGLAMLMACGASIAADQTWTGQISACARLPTWTASAFWNCVKAGEEYVLVSKGQIREIRNQEFGDLEKHAGHTVRLTGTLSPDGKSVTVSRIDTLSVH